MHPIPILIIFEPDEILELLRYSTVVEENFENCNSQMPKSGSHLGVNVISSVYQCFYLLGRSVFLVINEIRVIMIVKKYVINQY